MKYNPVNYLTKASEPWIKYNVSKNLTNSSTKEQNTLRTEMLSSSFIQDSIAICLAWDSAILKNHNDAKHALHRLELLAEFGLSKEDSQINDICNILFAHQSNEGMFQTQLLISEHFHGTGKPKWDWMICDAPIIIYFLTQMGYKDDPRIIKARTFLTSLISDTGVYCVSSIPKFRGPGKKTDSCPYAAVLVLKALKDQPDPKIQALCNFCIQVLTNFWEQRKEKKLFMFGMGSEFSKLKYPNVYFNIIHVLDVLSHFDQARQTKAYKEMLSLVNEKQAADGSFTPESVWMAFKGFDFADKKHSSSSLTYKIALINKRSNNL